MNMQSRTVLQVPESLRGRIKQGDVENMKSRNLMLMTALSAGYSRPELADAFNISPTTVSKVISNCGIVREKMAPKCSTLHGYGISLGSIGPEYDAQGSKVRRALLDLAIKHRTTIARALIKQFAETVVK